MKNFLFCFIMMLLVFASNAQPTITSFSPLSGSAGTIDTINGTGFNTVPTNNIVYYGATRAILIQATSVRLIVRVPTGATYQPISVTVGGLTGYSQLPFIIKSGNKVLPSIGQISFDNKFYVNDPHAPVLIASVDLDGDSKPDIAVSNNDSTISIYRNTSTSGSISMGARMDIQIKTPQGSIGDKGITYGDIDGDGKQDIIVSDYKNNLSSISIFRNTSSIGNISFATKVEYFTAVRSFILTVIDVDSDGKSDIVVSSDFSTSSSTFSVFRNTSSIGNISMATRVDITAGSDTRGVSVGDLDGDGKPDLIVLNFGGSSSFSVFRNTCSPGNISFTLVSNIAFNSPQWISLCDLDGDGKLDVIISGQSFPIFYYKNTSTIGSISLSGGNGFAGGNGSIVRNSFGDLNGDGKPETITFGSIIPNLSTPGNFLFGQINFYAGSSSTIIDFDGDGLNDILNINYPDTISIYRNNGTYPVIKSISPDSGKKNTNITMNVICSDVNFNSLSSAPQLQFKMNGSISYNYTVIKDTIINDTTMQYVFKFNNGAVIGKYSVVLNHSLFTVQIDSAFTLLSSNSGIEESNAQSHTFTIIPNPNNGKFEIASSNTITELEIFDITGNKIFSSFPNSSSVKIDLSGLRKGIYFVRSISENFVEIKKILVE